MDILKQIAIGLRLKAFFLLVLMGIFSSGSFGFSPLQAEDSIPPAISSLSGRSLLSQVSSAIPCLGYDFPSEVTSEMAFGIDANQTIHLLWTGRLRNEFNLYAFYSSSTDGQNWGPCQILDYWGAFEPQVAVDYPRGRVHLVYRSLNGISHRIVQQGVVSNPVVIDNHEGVVAPNIALERGSGRMHAVWLEGYLQPIDAITSRLQRRTFYSLWNGSTWAARDQIVNNEDTAYASLAINPSGGLMLAWFQNWAESQPKSGVDPGLSISPRTAFSPDAGLTFPNRVGVTTGYPPPQTDNALLMAYSAADNKFHLLTNHFMWPGHSIVYHYTWDGVGAWSAPEDLGKNPLDWAVPVYAGSSLDNRTTVFIWKTGGQLQMRIQEPSGTYSTVDLGSALAAQGYTVGTAAYQSANYFLHMVFYGQKDGQPGIYYVKVPIADVTYTYSYLPLIMKK
jgi:hypothetical protein